MSLDPGNLRGIRAGMEDRSTVVTGVFSISKYNLLNRDMNRMYRSGVYERMNLSEKQIIMYSAQMFLLYSVNVHD